MPGGEQLLADELGTLLVPGPARLVGVGLIGQLRVVPERLGAVVIAVDRQRLLAGRPAAVNHHRPRRVHLLDRLPGPRQHGLPLSSCPRLRALMKFSSFSTDQIMMLG